MEMKIAKLKHKKTINEVETQESYSIKSLIKIIIILIVVFGLFYLLTSVLVRNRKTIVEEPVAVIDSSKIIMNQLLNRKEKEYYVLATKSSLYNSSYVETNYIEFYNNYVNKYKQETDSLQFYYVDLDNALNKKYYGDETNITEDLSKLKLNDEVLFKISNNKIEKTYIGKEKILDKLSRL